MNMKVTYDGLEQILGIGDTTAKKIYKELVVFCDKGINYEPNYNDFARFKEWDIIDVLFYLQITKKEIVDLFLNTSRTITIKSKFAETTVFTIPIGIETDGAVNKLEVTPKGNIIITNENKRLD